MTEILHPIPDIDTGGQPSPEQLASLARDGVRTVINLRAPDEPVAFDEAGTVERLGMRYVSIPVDGAQALGPDTVERFSRALAQAREAGRVLVHCGSGNRVGAMLALDRGLTGGASAEEALALGRAAGLAGLEPTVARLLSHPSHA